MQGRVDGPGRQNRAFAFIGRLVPTHAARGLTVAFIAQNNESADDGGLSSSAFAGQYKQPLGACRTGVLEPLDNFSRDGTAAAEEPTFLGRFEAARLGRKCVSTLASNCRLLRASPTFYCGSVRPKQWIRKDTKRSAGVNGAWGWQR